MESGTISYKIFDFAPMVDLTIDFLNPFADLEEFGDFYFRGIYSDPRGLNDLTTEELRLLRNSYYVIHGYRFKSPDLLKYFEQFAWYYLDESIKAEDIELSHRQKQFMKEIIAE